MSYLVGVSVRTLTYPVHSVNTVNPHGLQFIHSAGYSVAYCYLSAGLWHTMFKNICWWFKADELHFSIIVTKISKSVQWVDVNKTIRKKHILLRYSNMHCNVQLKKTSSVEMVMRLYFQLETPIWNVPSLSYTTVIAK